MPLTALLDIDGTLVDTNYPHTLAWQRAFRSEGAVVPAWRIHRHIGMGGDKLVAAVTDEGFESSHGDAARERHDALFSDMLPDVEPLPGARDLVAGLKDGGHTVVLASSASAEEVEHHIDLAGVRELVDGWTTSADVGETKPAPDLVVAALDRAGAEAPNAVMIGDTIWDCEAAERAGVRSIGVLSGGFSNEELRDAGASQVFADAQELLARIDETPFAVAVAG
jgi:HAD superfamily hydrolase (TIGR01509 family)